MFRGKPLSLTRLIFYDFEGDGALREFSKAFAINASVSDWIVTEKFQIKKIWILNKIKFVLHVEKGNENSGKMLSSD